MQILDNRTNLMKNIPHLVLVEASFILYHLNQCASLDILHHKKSPIRLPIPNEVNNANNVGMAYFAVQFDISIRYFIVYFFKYHILPCFLASPHLRGPVIARSYHQTDRNRLNIFSPALFAVLHLIIIRDLLAELHHLSIYSDLLSIVRSSLI